MLEKVDSPSTMKCSVVAIAGAILVASVAGNEYCDLCPDHTLCLYSGISERCGIDIKIYGVNSTIQQLIVDTHNKLRNKVAMGKETRGTNGGQPSAANMRMMYWDEELAATAQRWAEQCDFRYDSCRDTDYMDIGQNGFAWEIDKYSVEPDWEMAINVWYTTVESLNSKNISPYKYSSYQYTQLAWAETHLVGCGFLSNYKDGTYRKYYFCNYGPAGNKEGQSMYKIGEPCSDCNEGCDTTYDGLCV